MRVYLPAWTMRRSRSFSTLSKINTEADKMTRMRDGTMGRRKPFRRVGCLLRKLDRWFNRRRYYVEQDSSSEDKREIAMDEPNHDSVLCALIDEIVTINRASQCSARQATSVSPRTEPVSPLITESTPSSSQNRIFLTVSTNQKFIRNRTTESYTGSIESLDSLVESYWDPEEDVSLETPVATNSGQQNIDLLNEHVDFLRAQTQPRQVETIWDTP